MLSSKKTVFYVLIILIIISSVNTGNNIYKKYSTSLFTGRATEYGMVFFEVVESPPLYNVSINTFWLSPSIDAAVVAGLPMGVNVTVLYENGTPVNGATVHFNERNGWSAFAPTQFWPEVQPYTGGVINYQTAESKTDSFGKTNFTVITTGGDSGLESIVGDYVLNVTVYDIYGTIINETVIESEDRTLKFPNGTEYDIPSESFINFVRDKMLTIFKRVSGWNGGENYAIKIYDDNTDNNTVITAVSGKPLGIYFEIINSTTLNPISDAKVIITEENGWSFLAPTQFWPDNIPYSKGVSNYQYAIAETDSLGRVNLTIIPTGGESAQESLIGNYNITINVTVDDAVIYSKGINIGDRDLPVAGTGYTVPNQGFIDFTRDKLLTLFNRVSGWL